MARYTVRLTDGSIAYADSIRDAKHQIREYARRIGDAPKDMVFLRCDDGIYAYEDQSAADADETGTRALAVIDTDDLA